MELQLLALQGLVSFELDLLLGELIKSLGVLESHSLDLFIHFVLLLASLLTVLLKLLVFLAHLLSKSLFLVLKGGYLTLFPRKVSCELLNLGDELAALFVELVQLLLKLS